MKSTIILFVSFLYCAIVQAQILNKEVFNLLNLNYPGLEQVKRAYYEDKLETAANELLKYYRKRTHVVNPFLDLANVTITPIEQGWADDAMQHTFFVHKGYQPSYNSIKGGSICQLLFYFF